MTHSQDSTELRRQVEQLSARNTRLADMLAQSRSKLGELAAQLSELAQPASSYGVFLEYSRDSSGQSAGGFNVRHDADIFSNGRRMRVKIIPAIEPGSLRPGELVRLGDGMVVVEACGFERTGCLSTVIDVLDDNRAVISAASGEEHVVALTQPVSGVRAGDTVMVDTKAGVALERIEKAEVSQLSLEEVPDVHFDDIGGLDEQISLIRDSVELPFVHPELFRQFDLRPPKGVLLYGPPGCGKTLIAKAVANSLSESLGAKAPSYFMNVKGPELLNKYVGETERRIRLIFERARELAARDSSRPVIVFFDEMESIFRTRGSGVSSDMETTVVPQLLTELDGVEDLHNVIVIGATNREELIDPAIMRPGRLDIKIRINRPGRAGARAIFERHFDVRVPHHGSRDDLIDAAVEELYADRPFVRLHFSGGQSRDLYYRDFLSGAMIANIIARAKKLAIKDALATNTHAAINARHLSQAIGAEQRESEHIPTSAHPRDWAKIVAASTADGRTVEHIELLGGRA